jgi:CubicO group peptidase (beta-lactamase class C family)
LVQIDEALVEAAKAELITVRHLLGHLSGIYNYTIAPELSDAAAGDVNRVYAPEELVGWAKAQHWMMLWDSWDQ